MNTDNAVSVPKIDSETTPDHAAEIKLKCNNWASDFPYTPEVTARLWHNDKTLFINYNVKEENIAALAVSDNGEVWKDSCVEFFFAPDGNGYYNLEANCTGKVLLSHRLGRKENVEYATSEVLDKITRDPSLGKIEFTQKKSDGPWSLQLAIPVSTFFKHGLNSFNGLKARCNIYKCGDDLLKPHFLSLFPINTPQPDFHRPEFFGEIIFE